MRKVLMKRYPRDLKANLFRYLSLFLLITFCMFLIISIVDAAERVIRGTERNQAESVLEDGQITTFTPFTEEQINEIEEAGITIEPHFNFEYMLDNGSILRLFVNREKIDKVALDNGELADEADEITLEKRFAAENDYKVGSVIKIGEKDFTVTGIGSSVDYDAPYRKLSDTIIDSSTFGIGFLTEEGYEELKKSGGGSEELTYAFLLGDNTASDFKEMVKNFDFDYKKVKDPYYQEMLSDTYGKKDEIEDGINDLVDGVKELSDGVDELKDGSRELADGMEELYDGSVELYDGTKELKDGTKEFKDGAAELTDGVTKLEDGANALESGSNALNGGLWSLNNGTANLRDALRQLTSNNAQIEGGADQIFASLLLTAQNSINEQLSAVGMPAISLSADNYSEVLTGLASQLSAAGIDPSGINETKNSLDGIAAYANGVKQYTGAVSQITEGAGQLADGSAQAFSGSGSLHDGTVSFRDGIAEFKKGTGEFTDATRKLDDGAKELSDGSKELSDGVKEAYDGSVELDDGVKELQDGVTELREGVDDLKEQSDEMIDKLFKDSPDNITEFMLKDENNRIGGAAGDLEMNRSVGLLAGVIVMILFTYVLSVFVIHQIQNESSVIGALYSLGVRKKELVSHYITLPTLVCFLGGLCGGLLGLCKFGSDTQMGDTYSYYSVPWFGMMVPLYLIIYAVAMPPLVSALVNYIVINKSLSRTALSLLRNEQKTGRRNNIKLGKMNFINTYRTRQLLREIRTALTILFGMIISLLVLMMGLDCYVLCESAGRLNSEDVKYQYMYSYKYPTKEPPEGGEPVYVQSLKKEQYGFNLDITVMGIDDDNPYIDVKTVPGKNKIIASDSVAVRYKVGVGDKIIFSDTANDIDYSFTVADIVPYSVGLTVFMDIDDMRELFGEDDDYYNVVMSDHELDIEEGRLYSVTSKADIDKAAGIFLKLMQSMFTMLIGASAVIFGLVMYLMIAVMIDRSSFGISLLKIFGFRKGEIKKLYLDGNRFMIIAGALVAVPVAKWFMDTIFPSFIGNVACAIHLEFPWYLYVMIFAGILATYEVINLFMMAKLNRVNQTEVLKNRE